MLQLIPHEQEIEDVFGVKRTVQEAIVPVKVWLSGKNFPIVTRDHDPI